MSVEVMLLQVVENTYTRAYTTLVFVWLVLSSYKFAADLGCFGLQLVAGECRWQCVRRGDELCQVFLPSGDSEREERVISCFPNFQDTAP